MRFNISFVCLVTAMMSTLVAAAKSTGHVKYFDKGQSYGYITPDEDLGDQAGDVYVNTEDIIGNSKTLAVGQVVQFDLIKGEDQYHAENVVVVNSS